MNKQQITIIGGDGLMGQFFAKLLKQLGLAVTKIDKQDWENAETILFNTTWAIISVPIHQTTAVIQKTAKLLNPNCILSDFTSIKNEPLITMLKEHPGPVVAMHPMFGPTIRTTTNQVIVYCDGRLAAQYAWVLEVLKELGFSLKPMTATAHDQAMSFIQGIEHFLTFGLGTFLYHKHQQPQQLLEVASPIYLAKLLLLGRIFDQDAALYADIIMADAARIALIKEFNQWLSQWITKLEQNDKHSFITEFQKASNWMGKFTSYSQQASDHLLSNHLTETF